jgi:predicted flap endonuclease-1-like 5' DNA nuclease
MDYEIKEIQGIGPAFAEKLSVCNIKTTGDLLTHCAEPAGRDRVSQEAGISSALILKWLNMADLMRISGIGPQFSELLEAAGVDTVKELRTRNAENLTAKMKEVNAAKKLARTSPAGTVVEDWIDQAKGLEPAISY